MAKYVGLMVISSWLAACVVVQTDNAPGVGAAVDVIKDSGPGAPLDVSHIPDAVPRHEPRTIAGNKSPYTVLGKTYTVMGNSEHFTQQGIASWYGNKFHGKRTANGEIYNMYGMTAAHKTLPIPSYVRVTNVENGRQVVVRVNDRGPFHEGRVIDLTYSAAAKLGFSEKGTAQVEVNVLQPGQSPSGATVAAEVAGLAASARSGSAMSRTGASSRLERAPSPEQVAGFQLPPNTFLQVGAFGSKVAAETLQKRIAAETRFPVFVSNPSDSLFRVRIGPIADNWALQNLRALLQKKQLAVPHVVYD